MAATDVVMDTTNQKNHAVQWVQSFLSEVADVFDGKSESLDCLRGDSGRAYRCDLLGLGGDEYVTFDDIWMGYIVYNAVYHEYLMKASMNAIKTPAIVDSLSLHGLFGVSEETESMISRFFRDQQSGKKGVMAANSLFVTAGKLSVYTLTRFGNLTKAIIRDPKDVPTNFVQALMGSTEPRNAISLPKFDDC
jgi:hypothetical protein